MVEKGSRLRTALRERHLQTHTAFCREYDKTAAILDPELVGSAPRRAQFHRWLSGDIKGLPYPHHCRILETMLPGYTVTELFTPDAGSSTYDIPPVTPPSHHPVAGIRSAPLSNERAPFRVQQNANAQTKFDDVGRSYLRTPMGRFFAGPDIPAVIFPATYDEGRVVATPTSSAGDPASHTPGRSLLVAQLDTADQPCSYVMDPRRAHSRLAAATRGAPLLFPRGYLLDDFTFALIWAVTSLDSALLDDDADLADAISQLDQRKLDADPTVAGTVGLNLSSVSRMWVGSQVCAEYILRHADRLTGTPQFWSREQRGEEASSWLLFRHKYEYLRATTQLQSDRPVRAFCIPPDAVRDSARPERILLMLAAVLHESTGITTVVCTEPEYTSTPGFVLDRSQHAVVANWVNTDRIWHVDITDHRPTMREFDDAVGWAQTRTIVPGHTPHYRLHALADYLDLDWRWLTHRATELDDSGITGLCAPRSRLLSTTGVERACSFLADLTRDQH